MSKWRQPSLPGVKAKVSSSKRGKGFEAEIEAVNDFYRLQGIVDAVKNEEKWTCFDRLKNGQTADDYLQFQAKGSNKVAVAGDGWIYRRENSDVDFSGGNDSGAYIFDAKETARNTISMDRLEPHQIARLHASAKSRTVAGFLINFTTLDRVFFAPIRFVRLKEEIWHSQGEKRAAPGTASISIKELEENGNEVFRHHRNDLWDWYAVLSQLKEKQNGNS